ncbi:unnamed protein product [Owenia fusiformis]|uniref:Uncharacterized protein n=1 Tax=Owenia fusiformis TaxID=6347 RepID=A0A8J1XUI9_OWEFU|nr:unnamed protein product [Owenia fusiformis]
MAQAGPPIPTIKVNAPDKEASSPKQKPKAPMLKQAWEITSTQYGSLPNLFCDNTQVTKRIFKQDSLQVNGKSKLATSCENVHQNKLGVYCTPRLPRRNKDTGVIEHGGDIAWLDAFDPARSIKRSRSSTASSGTYDFLVRAVSNVSICGSSDRDFAFSSFDRCSLPGEDIEPGVFGTLRRANSTPDASYLYLRTGSKKLIVTKMTRDARSCSNLKQSDDANIPELNHNEVDVKFIEGEEPQFFIPPSNMSLSMPVFRETHDGEGNPKTFEQMYREAYERNTSTKGKLRETSHNSAECRIQNWLEGLSMYDLSISKPIVPFTESPEAKVKVPNLLTAESEKAENVKS